MTSITKVAIFYGSTTCYTEMAGEKIQQQLQQMLNTTVDLFDIKDTSLTKICDYQLAILGISTWDFGELQEDWESTWDDIASLNLEGVTVALYGLGDQLGYADWFQDALGMLHDEVLSCGCDVIGYWPNEGYEFTASKALTDDNRFFVGLSLDDENQYDLSDERIAKWSAMLVEQLQ